MFAAWGLAWCPAARGIWERAVLAEQLTTTPVSNPVLDGLAMGGVWTLLAGWAWLAGRLDCGAGAAVIAAVWGLILLAASELALLRRHVFVWAYLTGEGFIARWLGRRALLLAWQAVKSLPLALALVVSLPLLRGPQWLVLLLDVAFLSALLWLLQRALRGEVRPAYRTPLAHAWAHRINSVSVWLGLLLTLLYAAREDYAALGLVEVVRYSAAQVDLGCDALAVLARLGAVAEGALWWAAQRLFSDLGGTPQALVAWSGFIAVFGASFVIAWSYSRALTGVLARPWRYILPVGTDPDRTRADP